MKSITLLLTGTFLMALNGTMSPVQAAQLSDGSLGLPPRLPSNELQKPKTAVPMEPTTQSTPPARGPKKPSIQAKESKECTAARKAEKQATLDYIPSDYQKTLNILSAQQKVKEQCAKKDETQNDETQNDETNKNNSKWKFWKNKNKQAQ